MPENKGPVLLVFIANSETLWKKIQQLVNVLREALQTSEKLGAPDFTCGWLRMKDEEVASGPLDYQFNTESDHSEILVFSFLIFSFLDVRTGEVFSNEKVIY